MFGSYCKTCSLTPGFWVLVSIPKSTQLQSIENVCCIFNIKVELKIISVTQLTIAGQKVEKVNNFLHIGIIASTDGNTELYMGSRIAKSKPVLGKHGGTHSYV